MPHAFARIRHAFELPDFLLFRATDGRSDVRSHCCVVCKWNYDPEPCPHPHPTSPPDPLSDPPPLGWDRSFIESIGFTADELLPPVIGQTVAAAGSRVGCGLGETAAKELGLLPSTALAVGLIDAHAGGVGCVGPSLPSSPAAASDPPPPRPPLATSSSSAPPPSSPSPTLPSPSPQLELTSRLALICGTSTCHMASSQHPCFVRGVWGPYKGGMFDQLYLNEGGQSAAGALLDHVIGSHACGQLLSQGEPTEALHATLEQMAAEKGCALPLLASDLHLTPDFLGNRSPLADPTMRGGVIGLTLPSTLQDLAILYLATLQSLAYGSLQIVRAMEAAGHPPFRAVFACGGLSKNHFYLQAHADALNLPVFTPEQPEAVLLGAAVLAATAGGAHACVADAMGAMTAVGQEVRPCEDAAVRAYHERKYKVFLRMSEDQRAYRQMMAA